MEKILTEQANTHTHTISCVWPSNTALRAHLSPYQQWLHNYNKVTSGINASNNKTTKESYFNQLIFFRVSAGLNKSNLDFLWLFKDARIPCFYISSWQINFGLAEFLPSVPLLWKVFVLWMLFSITVCVKVDCWYLQWLQMLY